MRRALAIGVLVVGACTDEPERLAWGIGVASFDAAALGLAGGPPDGLAALAPVRHLVVPTYDGSGQAVHPDVVRERDRIVMAFTPYPYSDDDFENPSVVVSADGVELVEPRANPLAEKPAIDHNNDPDLHVDPATGEYELLYLETLRPDAQNLVSLRSRDLIGWTREVAIAWDLSAGAPFVVSPAAIVHGGVTSLFVVGGDSRTIQRLDSPDGRRWPDPVGTPIALVTGDMVPWHVDVFAYAGGYGMLINGDVPDVDGRGKDRAFVHQDLWLATSPDLVTWTLRPEPVLAHDDAALGVTSLYRASGIVAGDRLIIWYSHQYRE